MQCNCLSNYCHGTFRVSIDGVVGPSTGGIDPVSDDGTLVVAALNSLPSMINSGLSASCTVGLGEDDVCICISATLLRYL